MKGMGADNWNVKTVLDRIAEGVATSNRRLFSLKDVQEKYLPGESHEKIREWAGELQSLGVIGLDYSAESLLRMMEKQETQSIIIQTKSKYSPIEKVIESYHLKKNNIPAIIEIIENENELTLMYVLRRPQITPLTETILHNIRGELIKIPMPHNANSQEASEIMEETYREHAKRYVKLAFPGIIEGDCEFLADMLIIRMLGFGDIDIIMADDWIEDICINGRDVPIWLYHRKYGWLKTNLKATDDKIIREMAELSARKTSQQISEMNPLLDAQSPTGDRINATLSVVSVAGNTLTIRKFARKPWTIIDFINSNQASVDLLAFLWMGIQYELNFMVVGGTASGKTSFLNALSVFVPPNQRIISIEDTRELHLPDFSHWIPMRSKPANAEGRGEVKMLDLILNSLRMRPDRLFIGEIRRKEHVEVMFEAIHTGHSCYSTFHADDAYTAFRRLIAPPISLNPIELETMHGIVSVHRDRRSGKRRVLEIAEMAPSITPMGIEPHIVYRYSYLTQKFEHVDESLRIIPDLARNTGTDILEIKREIDNRKEVLRWMAQHNLSNMTKIAVFITNYYKDKRKILRKIKTLTPEELLNETA